MFAWKITDMPRVDPEVMCHNLGVRVGAKPVKHKVGSSIPSTKWSTLHKLDLSRRMVKWDVELSELGLRYLPCLSLKRQVLVDFIIEWPKKPVEESSDMEEWWILRIDRVSRSLGARVGLVLQASTEKIIEQAIWLGFSALNNEAEYEALSLGIELVLVLSTRRLEVGSDSQLVVSQIQGQYEARDARMIKYLEKVKQELQQFEE
ncbi:hypothetical protein CK203_031851 [Vitis vinifera]|uniref:RNase H type-1 domain-containing protein n=1 Tax=Vitis vinifera TaxID=29760 RepID=A0A438IN37_VITVI|nr:hypothetical protein CK203_031851 [Vitis vinifera]